MMRNAKIIDLKPGTHYVIMREVDVHESDGRRDDSYIRKCIELDTYPTKKEWLDAIDTQTRVNMTSFSKTNFVGTIIEVPKIEIKISVDVKE